MRKITVDKADLAETITRNRDAHKAEYDKAVEVYRVRFVEEAKKFAEDSIARSRQRVAFGNFVWLPVPEEHTEDYDRALLMLDWELGDTVELSQEEFATLVQNQWNWIRSFTANTSSYVSGSN